jgi:hypothetical protein
MYAITCRCMPTYLQGKSLAELQEQEEQIKELLETDERFMRTQNNHVHAMTQLLNVNGHLMCDILIPSPISGLSEGFVLSSNFLLTARTRSFGRRRSNALSYPKYVSCHKIVGFD